MRFKAYAFIFVCVILVLDGIEATKFSLGTGSSRGSSRGGSYGSSRGSSRGGSYASSRGSSHGLSHGTSFGRTPQRTSHSGRTHVSPTSGSRATPHGGTSPTTTGSQNTAHHVNTQFLHGEGGGATRPAQTMPSQPPYPTNLHPVMPGHVPPVGKPVVTESRQTSPLHPSAPSQDHIMKSTAGVTQNQGHSSTGPANPPWSNPYLNNNKPAAPVDTHPAWKPNPVPNQGTPSVPSGSPWNNPRPGDNKPFMPNSQPSVPGSQPPPVGFRDHVYPQTHPTSAGTQFSPPRSGNPPYPIHPMPMPTSPHLSSSASGHPPYPTHPMPSGSPWSNPSMSPPLHQTNSMPLGNPYSMHPHAGAYGAPAGVPNGPMHYGQTYHPQQMAQPAVQPFIPGQTILMVPGQQSSGPGFGQLVKEALVFSTINAGVNRLINPHTRYVETRPAETAPSTTTHITYNNHYINTAPGADGNTNPTSVPQGNAGSIAPYIPPASSNPTGGFTPNVGNSNVPSGNTNSYIPSIPASVVSNTSPAVSGTTTTGSQNLNNNPTNSAVPQSNLSDSTVHPEVYVPTYRISDDELYKITEELFAKNPHNLSKYIKLNLQAKAASTNITDQAKEPLFEVDPELFEYPTIYVTRSLYDTYEHDFRKKLNRTLETRKQENLLIDTVLETSEMSSAMRWLADKGFIDPDDFEKKDVLRRIWFTIFSGSTCGFERVFAAENYGTAVIGVQDWIYFASQESLKRMNYMGYVDKLDLGNTASLLKLNFEMDGIVRPNATIFIGTLPELEMSLYTICFHARPNNVCPVSLGGTKFTIYTHSFTYFGKEVIDLGLPMF
ncbi:poly(U)-specific endoribonuclease homolog [Ceratina calcarata]|uniref:Poly(U)-specific endoribonuclease homolog n=1 Tax=Ceratina calcarata TaxID=156304 RepID=A0AAJ7NF38_9HYME|nr:poly(U)-specific endoribonuclease homolog [Ceratina calcarata]